MMQQVSSVSDGGYRWAARAFLVLVFLLSVALVFAGCEGRALDEETGREVTATEAISLAEKREARALAERAKADAAAKAERAEIESKAQRDKLEAAAAAKDAIREEQAAAEKRTQDAKLAQQRSAIEFRAQTAQLENEYKIKLGQLTQTFDVAQAELLVVLSQAEGSFAIARERIGDEFERRVSAADRRIADAAGAEKEKLAANGLELEDKLSANERDTQDKLEQIEKINARYMGIANMVSSIPGVKAAAGSVGVDLGGIQQIILGGALSGAGMAWRSRRRERDTRAEIDAAYDEGRRVALEHAKAADEAKDKSWDEAENRALRLLMPPPTTRSA